MSHNKTSHHSVKLSFIALGLIVDWGSACSWFSRSYHQQYPLCTQSQILILDLQGTSKWEIESQLTSSLYYGTWNRQNSIVNIKFEINLKGKFMEFLTTFPALHFPSGWLSSSPCLSSEFINQNLPGTMLLKVWSLQYLSLQERKYNSWS